MFNRLNHIFDGLCINPTPMEFGNALTTAEFLANIKKLLNDVIEKYDSYSEEMLGYFQNEFNKIVAQFKEQLDFKFQEYLPTLKEYCVQYIAEMLADSLKYITFELTDDGYFCANIPDVWASDIEFDTDYSEDNFGKLVIRY